MKQNIKQNIKFFGITLALAVVVMSPLIGGKMAINKRLLENVEDYTPAASVISDEVISMQDSKYGSFTYNKYENPRFGFKIEYPSFLTSKRESDNGDGIILQNSENTVVLIVSGINNALNETPKNLYDGYVNNTKGITYKKLVGNSFMISAESGNNGYFIYEVVGEGSINTFIIGYPKEDEKVFDDIIKQMKQTFETPYIHKAK